MQLSDSDPEAKESVNQKQNLNFFLSSHFLPELPMEWTQTEAWEGENRKLQTT